MSSDRAAADPGPGSQTLTESGAIRVAGPVLVPGLTILWHPDPARAGERVALTSLAAGRSQALSRIEPAFAPPRGGRPVPLDDPYLSRRAVRLEPSAAGLRLHRADSPTSVVLDGTPVAVAAEIAAADLARGVTLLLGGRVLLLLHELDPGGASDLPELGLIGESAAIARVREQVMRVAPGAAPVLVRGESGTGKELVARALHQASPRRDGPYVTVNAAAIPVTLAGAELFGSERGAFTGADASRPGYFGRAHGGTLVLDEVGDVPLDVQLALLRALESGEVQRVGASVPGRVDVRVVAATDADLVARVAAGTFRATLLHRLASHEIQLPPLRARRDDLGRLLRHFLNLELAAAGAPERLRLTTAEARPWLPAPLVARLAAHAWPGNVRELRNVVRRLALSFGAQAEVTELPPHLSGPAAAGETPLAANGSPREHEERPRVTDEEIAASLRAHGWRVQRAARALGLSRATLYDRIDQSPLLRKASDLPRAEIEAAVQRCQGDLDAAAAGLEVSKRGLQRRMRRLGIPWS